jgi:excisionase family DNA binding protein
MSVIAEAKRGSEMVLSDQQPISKISAKARSGSIHGRPLLTVTQAAVLLGTDRSTLYKAIGDNRFPLPVIRLNRQILIPRAALDRLISGELDYDAGGAASEGDRCPTCGTSIEPSAAPPLSTIPTWSAARRSSSAMASV